MIGAQLASPLIWFGGKGMFLPKLLPLIPEHMTYVEVFGGGASLLLAKNKSFVEIFNDIDSQLVTFFRVLQEPDEFAELQRLLSATPMSEEFYNEFRVTWESEEDRVRRVWKWFTVVRQSFAGQATKNKTGGWSGITKVKDQANQWLLAIERLPEVAKRMTQAQLLNRDWRKVLPAFDGPDTFFYLDPPYVHDTRSGGGYAFEMTNEDHAELVEQVQKLEGRVLISGYNHEIYKPLDNSPVWERQDFETVAFVAGKSRIGDELTSQKPRRTESVWTNYAIQLKLFQ